MRAIRSRDTKPEILVRQLLHAKGFRFRIHRKDLPGKPDIVLPKYKSVILVHGCFWHGHQCYLFKVPTTRRDFWLSKISANCIRDKRDVHQLLQLGWRVLVIWECAIKGRLKLTTERVESEIVRWLHSSDKFASIGTTANPVALPESSAEVPVALPKS
jgi:DNA mismatch endonuclease, patch repair protein